jgi:hypothetical protein
MSGSTESDVLLRQLVGDTDAVISEMESRTGNEIESQLADIEQKFSEVEQISDEKEQERRLRILEAEFQTLREDTKKEEGDLSKAVFGLNGILEAMGQEYTNLGNPSEADLAKINSAKQSVDGASVDLAIAEKKTWFRASAVKKANEKIATTKARLKQAQDTANQNARQLLMNADMETSLQQFQIRVEKTINIMEDRMEQIKLQVKAVTARKTSAFEAKEAAAQDLERLDVELSEKEADLRREEEDLSTHVNGTAEHSAQTQKVSDLRADVEDIRGKRNTAFTLFQSKEKFATELEIHERTQMKLRDNQKMWIVSLRSDTEERVVTFKSRLEAMKAMSDQKVAQQLDDLGAEVDQANAEFMARAGSASDRARMEKVEKHPERILEMTRVQEAQAESMSVIRKREGGAIAQFKEKYGIDPTASSFFHYAEEDGS